MSDLASKWNEMGRAYHGEISRRLEKFYGGEEVDLNVSDPRTPEQGAQVLEAVKKLHAAGKNAREHFDPAYAPFLPVIEEFAMNLPFVTLLGPEELLVRRGPAWQTERAL